MDPVGGLAAVLAPALARTAGKLDEGTGCAMAAVPPGGEWMIGKD